MLSNVDEISKPYRLRFYGLPGRRGTAAGLKTLLMVIKDYSAVESFTVKRHGRFIVGLGPSGRMSMPSAMVE